MAPSCRSYGATGLGLRGVRVMEAGEPEPEDEGGQEPEPEPDISMAEIIRDVADARIPLQAQHEAAPALALSWSEMRPSPWPPRW